MDSGLSVVLAAVVAAFGGIIVAIVQLKSFRTENRDDHAMVQKRLDTVIDMVAKTSSKLTNHLEWHTNIKEPAKDRIVKRVVKNKK